MAKTTTVIVLALGVTINLCILAVIFGGILGGSQERTIERGGLTTPARREKDEAQGPTLSNVMFVIDGSDDLESLRTTFDFWKKYPPCMHDSSPTRFHLSSIGLLFLIQGPASPGLREGIDAAYHALPPLIRTCFSGMTVRVVEAPPRATAPSGGSGGATSTRRASRDFFTSILQAYSVGSKGSSQALLLGADCKPIRQDWLNKIDEIASIPIDVPWMRGSIFRGLCESPPLDFGRLVALSSSALYTFGDGSFADFYLDRVSPWADENIYGDISAAPDAEPSASHSDTAGGLKECMPAFDRWSTDLFQYLANYTASLDWFEVTHKFRHVAFLANYGPSGVSLDRLLAEEEEADSVHIVCGRVLLDKP